MVLHHLLLMTLFWSYEHWSSSYTEWLGWASVSIALSLLIFLCENFLLVYHPYQKGVSHMWHEIWASAGFSWVYRSKYAIELRRHVENYFHSVFWVAVVVSWQFAMAMHIKNAYLSVLQSTCKIDVSAYVQSCQAQHGNGFYCASGVLSILCKLAQVAIKFI